MMEQEHPHRVGNSGICSLCREDGVTFVVFLYDAFSSSTVPFRFIAISFALEPLFSSKHPGDL